MDDADRQYKHTHTCRESEMAGGIDKYNRRYLRLVLHSC